MQPEVSSQGPVLIPTWQWQLRQYNEQYSLKSFLPDQGNGVVWNRHERDASHRKPYRGTNSASGVIFISRRWAGEQLQTTRLAACQTWGKFWYTETANTPLHGFQYRHQKSKMTTFATYNDLDTRHRSDTNLWKVGVSIDFLGCTRKITETSE